MWYTHANPIGTATVPGTGRKFSLTLYANPPRVNGPGLMQTHHQECRTAEGHLAKMTDDGFLIDCGGEQLVAVIDR
jgi:hypothetical protein